MVNIRIPAIQDHSFPSSASVNISSDAGSEYTRIATGKLNGLPIESSAWLVDKACLVQIINALHERLIEIRTERENA